MEDNKGGVPFNMALMFYEELTELRKLKSRFYILGDLRGYRDALEEIFSSISIMLSDDEKKSVVKLFNIANKHMNAGNLKAKSYYREADMLIMGLMHKYNMIFPDNKNTHGLGDIKKRYGLGGKN